MARFSVSQSGARRERRRGDTDVKRALPFGVPVLSRSAAILAIVVCALIWGTTWFAITLQLGPVDPIASIVWRFGLAAALLFVGCAATRRALVVAVVL